ncbi:unnamed protein product [Urochloa humidicola]
MVASSSSHMLSLANSIAEDRRSRWRSAAGRRGGPAPRRLCRSTRPRLPAVRHRRDAPAAGGRTRQETSREVFDALGSQITDIVLTAHPTQFVQRSLLQKHDSRQILAAFRTEKIRRG